IYGRHPQRLRALLETWRVEFIYLWNVQGGKKKACLLEACVNLSLYIVSSLDRCFTGYVGDLCQFVDPCTHKQCQNGGTCSLQMLRPPNPPTSTCLCLPGFTGEQCQGLVGDPCFPSPCQHGGSCQRLSGKQYQCQCVSGWTGKNCQLMDFCPANPCANGGTCVITYPVIVCQCRPGFEGHTCQHDVNECFGDTNPCLNGGRCINSVGSFRCVCPPNSSGPLCQYRLAPCSPEICLNGGTCHEVDERYHGCLCLPGYTGQYCEVNPDDCVGNQCSNGGTCLDGLGSYSCQCLSGWTGKVGERLHCHLHDACLGNACHPDAHCDTDLLTGHAVCTCQQGYTGALCNEDIDECQMGADPCEHGGSCHNTLGSFTCRCPEGYTGSRCESNLNECLSQPCHNGASCLDLACSPASMAGTFRGSWTKRNRSCEDASLRCRRNIGR
uniref:EGF-like domain-containing protein n=1 Tax=Anolis carolinensis TaxID=28377 RepID=A0A803SM50_ANOCA